MISLSKKAKDKNKQTVTPQKRISIRDKLLLREVQEMDNNLPRSCKTVFSDKDVLHTFTLYITPDEGYWQGGSYKFTVHVPEDYNIAPPKVTCQTRIWHPNITEEGEVCLSLLRQHSFDSMGWAPTRRLKDVVWGLNSLFTDLLNFDDPLNVAAAEHWERDKVSFQKKVKEYVMQYAKR